ncbi:MAG: DUF3604 domain-containing protein [Candidatus Hydrogenedentota bacterium]
MKTFQHIWVAGLIVALSTTAYSEEANRKALFGELHMHTAWSFDAYLFNTRATPDDAYNFAKGKPLKHALGKTYQLTRPLDFMAVTDHGMFLGAFAKMADPTHPLSKLPIANKVNSPDPDIMSSAFRDIVGGAATPALIRGLTDPAIMKETWDHIIDSANRHNDPGTFTALIGYEWTSTPNSQNLHRNVIFRGDTAPIPFTRIQSDRPEDLWAWMDKVREEGNEVLAIPHNSNLSDGRMFEREDSWDIPFTKEYAEARNRNERLVEVTQVKGTSETHPTLSPNDEFADFELLELYVAMPIPITKFKGSYVRDAYRTGLEFQEENGFNPYRFGLIAASDSHTGIVPVDENQFSGKISSRDGSPENRLVSDAGKQRYSFFGASGLAGVWADENTREDIFDALDRKETWGTSGPRIQVRFFGGFDMADVKPGDDGWVNAAYAGGVPMGGELKATQAGDAPTFALWAIKDAEGANLDRFQVVKGWIENGESHEQVYDAVWSGDRVKDSKTGKVPAIKNTVNLDTLEYSNSVGSVELMGTWSDPNFKADQNAFYYVRVLEIPTPRWSMFDAKELGIPIPTDHATTIQERAYSSPIWYDHH